MYIQIQIEGVFHMNKPNFDLSKSNSFFALGFIQQKPFDDKLLQSYLYYPNATIESVSGEIKRHYDADDILYFEYDQNGDAVKAPSFDDIKTAAFAIETDHTTPSGEKIYARYGKTNRGWTGVKFLIEKDILKAMNQYKIGILSFEDYSSANTFICKLEQIILPGELWKYSKEADGNIRRKTGFQILESYLTQISLALAKGNEDKKSLNYGKIITATSQDKQKTYALFNTGLLTKYATDILIVGEKVNSRWQLNLSNPTVVTRGVTELGKYGFSIDNKPDIVSFFRNVSEIVYNANVPIDLDNYDKLQHCIDDGIKRGRFPDESKRMYESGNVDGLMQVFKGAIERSVTIARRNYKYVIPQYRNTEDGCIQFLMPIYMQSQFDKSPDFALVLSLKTIGEKQYYIPETVLELAWAYNNARAICKPDNTWLNPEKIEDSAFQEDED